MNDSGRRLATLDAFRALAALMVVAYHYFARWTAPISQLEVTPRIGVLADNPVISHGFLGVEFFFLISGFVIPMTLLSTRGPVEFFVKRFARLFPAMLVCSLITFGIVGALKVAPFHPIDGRDFIPSLLFVDPNIVNRLTGLDTHYISGVYWSLFVEVKFYAFAALLYFLDPRRFFVNFTSLVAVISIAFVAGIIADWRFVTALLEYLFFPRYAPFLLAGVAFHEMYRRGRSAPILVPVVATLCYFAGVSAYFSMADTYESAIIRTVLISAFFALFLLFVRESKLLRPFDNRVLTSIGIASYSLYLVHEPVGVSLIALFAKPGITYLLVALIVMALAVLASMLLYRTVEAPARHAITRLLLPHRNGRQRQTA